MDIPSAHQVAFDIAAFDEATRAHGVSLVHFRAIPCPVGMIDKYDSRRPHEDHAGCSNGYIYRKAGEVIALMSGVSKELKQNDVGLIDGSTAQVTSPRFYEDGEQFHVMPFDRFYLSDEAVTVPKTQRTESNISGVDKLNFPVEKVELIVDANGRFYDENCYQIENGRIRWLDGPGYDLENQKGVIYSIRYHTKPYWYCTRLLHEVRIVQVEDMMERTTVRAPQQFILVRESFFESEANDELAPDPNSDRQVQAPQ
jgi:hypothetical protein